MELYLVRHGVTAWNDAGRYQGVTDTDLTGAGLAQAARTAGCLAALADARGTPFAAVYSSPLLRAWRTAEVIGERLGRYAEPVPEIREMDGGAVEGLTLAEWQQRYPALVPAWLAADDLDFAWPGGESRRAFRDRCLRGLGSILARHAPRDHIVVVAHAGVIRALLLGLVPHAVGESTMLLIDNCSITRLQVWAARGSRDQPGWSVARLRVLNDVGHVAPLVVRPVVGVCAAPGP